MYTKQKIVAMQWVCFYPSPHFHGIHDMISLEPSYLSWNGLQKSLKNWDSEIGNDIADKTSFGPIIRLSIEWFSDVISPEDVILKAAHFYTSTGYAFHHHFLLK